MFGKSIRVAAAAFLVALLPLAAYADEPVSTRLDNGLRVVVQRLSRAPVVAVQIWVKAGSRMEVGPEKGLTHQIEHMIFKGTPTRGLGQVAGQIEKAGGRINAYTAFDHTVYHTVLPSDYWKVGLDVLGDAVMNSLFEASELAKEKEVVLEEWRRGQDSPRRKLAEEVFAAVFTKSPYGDPIIGYEKTIRNFTRDQILKYMAKWYTARRVTVVVVGKVDPEQVLAEARRIFKNFRTTGQKDFKPTLEPPQKELRFKAVSGRVKQAYLALAFRTQGLKDPRTPATDLLAELLGGGQAARLPEILWGKQGLVRSIHASSFTPLDEGFFWISSALEPDKLDQALQAVWRELTRTRSELFRPEELARAKLAFTASLIREKETMEGQADKLGFFELLAGGLEKEKEYLKAIRNLTAEDLRSAARDIFRPENLTLVVMLPEGMKLPKIARFEKYLTLPPDKTGSVAKTQGPAAAAAAAEKSTVRPSADPDSVKVMKLPGGVTLLVKEDHSLPLWAVKAFFLGGTRLEPADKAGAMSLLASTWTRGAAGLSAEELARRIEDMAGSISADSGRHTLSLSGSFLSRFFGPGLDLFARVLLNPSFDPQEVARRKADQLAAIKAREEKPVSVAFRLFNKNIYQGHPYSRDTLGTQETVSGLTPKDLKELYDGLVKPGNLVLAVVGDVDPDKVRERLTALLAPLKGEFKPALPQAPPPLPKGGLKAEKIKPGQAQVHLILGFRAARMTDADSCALDILAEALSNQSGRLFMELRDKKSLAYTVAAFNSPGLDAGVFGFYIASAPEKEEQARKEFLVQVERIRTEPLSKEEFEGARARLLAQWILDRQSMSARAGDLALYDRLGLGWDYARRYAERIRNLTPEKILAVAKKYLDPQRSLWVRVGP